MDELKKKIVEMVEKVEDIDKLEYLFTFIRLLIDKKLK